MDTIAYGVRLVNSNLFWPAVTGARSQSAGICAGKHVIALTCLLFLLVFTGSVFVSADDVKIVKVGIYENQPKIFTDDNGSAAGFWPDVIGYIASQEGWKVQYVPGTWTECLKRLENKEIDMMPDVAYSEERNLLYAFSREPVYTSWSRVYMQAGGNINSILDLEGKKIAVLKGSVNVEGADGIKQLVKAYNISCTLIQVDSYARIFELIERGEADAGVTSKDFGYRNEGDYKVVKTAIIFQPSQLYFAFPKDGASTPYLIEKIDRNIKILKQDNNSVYYRSLDKWLAVKSSVKPVIPAWLIMTVAGIGGLAVLLAGGSFLLRSQVRTRTRELTAEIDTRKRAELELAKYRDHLEELVRERTAELAVAKEHAESTDRLKSAFLATMSHELRTPLNSIIGFTGILQQEMVGPLNAEQKKELGMVRNSSSHLLNLINDVLDISKIEAGQLTVASEPCDLRAAIEKVVQNMRILSEKKGLVLEADVKPEVGQITSDQRRVEQIILNLVSNAIKFTDSGSIRIECGRDGEEYIISISDTGIGIKRADLDQIFQPFFQIDSGIVRQREGTGLGLSICKKILDLLGGRIWVESEWGRGSTFSFALPVERRS